MKKRYVIRFSPRQKRKFVVSKQAFIAIIVAVIAVLFALVFLAGSAFAVENIPEATSQFYVNDFAEVLTDEQEQKMLARAVALAEKPEGIQVVVTTVSSMGSYSNIDDYANDMYNQYKIGRDGRGILIVMSFEYRDYRVEVGDGLEGYMTDSKIGRFVDKYAIDYWRKNQFDVGLVNLQKALIEDLDAHFESIRVTAEPEVGIVDNPISRQTDSKNNSITQAEENTVSPLMLILSILGIVFLFGFVLQSYNLRKCNEENDEMQDKFQDECNRLKRQIKDLTQEVGELTSTKQLLGKKMSDQAKSFSDIIEEKNEQYGALKQDMNREVDRLDAEIDSLQKSYEKLYAEHENLKDRYAHAKKVHPKLDIEVNDLYKVEEYEANLAIAQEFDKKYQSLEEVKPSSDISFQMFSCAMGEYQNFTEDQAKLVKTNMKIIEFIYNESRVLLGKKEAESYTEKVRKACNGVDKGTESTLNGFTQMYNEYSGMPDYRRKFVDVTQIALLTKLIEDGKKARQARLDAEEAERRRKAEEERKRREEEERRRKAEEERRRRQREEEEAARRRRMNSSMYHSSSHSSFSSHHSGFGGHSSGGGRSGKF